MAAGGYIQLQGMRARIAGGGEIVQLGVAVFDETGAIQDVGEFSEQEVGALLGELQSRQLPLVCDISAVQILVDLTVGVAGAYAYDALRSIFRLIRSNGGFIGSGGEPPSKIILLLGEAKGRLASVLQMGLGIHPITREAIEVAVNRLDSAISLLVH